MFWRKKRTYLDAAAGVSGPSPRRSWLRPRGGGNPSSPHKEGRRSREILEGARTTIARLLEVQSDDVIFTSGATEANALAILGSLRAGRTKDQAPRTKHALYLPSAHASVVENMKALKEEGIDVEELPIRTTNVDIEKLAEMIRPETALVSMDAVCGETGVVWNTREVASALREPSRAKRGIVLHVDASQAPLTEKVTRAHFGADMLTLDASKISTTRGIGVLVAHRTIPIAPLYRGGGQERGLRPGSEVPKLAERFAGAPCAAAQGRDSFRARAERDRMSLMSLIGPIPRILINEGPSTHGQVPHIVNLSLPARDTDYLAALLDEAGFAVSTRSACETDSQEGSRAVFALTGDRERARATLRISWGPGVQPRELANVAKELARAVAFIDSSSRR